jgi:hypothetical protein
LASGHHSDVQAAFNRVDYYGEQFENDGGIGLNLLKTVKRVMAGEYASRIVRVGLSRRALLAPRTE